MHGEYALGFYFSLGFGPCNVSLVTTILRLYSLLYYNQGWQYGTVRSEFAYYVPHTFNRTAPTYRTSTITKKAYRTSVSYFLAKIEAYRSVLTYRTVLQSLLLTTRNFN